MKGLIYVLVLCQYVMCMTMYQTLCHDNDQRKINIEPSTKINSLRTDLGFKNGVTHRPTK